MVQMVLQRYVSCGRDGAAICSQKVFYEGRIEKRKLENKVSPVTGSSRGIGRAIAIKLAEEGADIVY